MQNSKQRRKERPSIPDWAGRYPFEPDQKKPCLLKRESALPRLFGKGTHKVPTYLYVSTDRITSTEFHVPPGEYFEPCDIHGGEEVYYVHRGRAVVLDPQIGRTYVVSQGSLFYIPRLMWHQTYNFSDEELVIIPFFAPIMWCEDFGTEVDYPHKPLFFKGKEAGSEKALPGRQSKSKTVIPDHSSGQLGQYPVSGKEARENNLMFAVTPCQTLNLIHGDDNHIFVSFFVSNEIIHTGTMTIPGFRESASEVHQGDEVFCVLDGAVSVIILDEKTSQKTVSVSRFEVFEGDRFLIPEGTRHRYYNHGSKFAKMLFSVAPTL